MYKDLSILRNLNNNFMIFCIAKIYYRVPRTMITSYKERKFLKLIECILNVIKLQSICIQVIAKIFLEHLFFGLKDALSKKHYKDLIHNKIRQ